MILFNNLDKFFKNTSVIFVDSRVKKDNKITVDDLVFFVDKDNNISSINVLDNNKYLISNDSKFGTLNFESINKIEIAASKAGLKISNEPKFIYGLIKTRSAHPKSERLFVLEVLINDEKTIQIVTNTLDSHEGKVVVLALPGATTFAGTDILSGEMLGVKSEGMLTGYRTLGIDKDGLIFGTENEIGKDFVL
ncbi:TyrS-associated PheT N-terminal domain-related protein TapR [Mycoplasmopsis verecunda]|uniref:tRNA-binding protein n=1 Tax=Mycoplasmopsis verecunda TaxID=171291 RepID=A0A1T4LHA4_9BACT|nr:hypothetical protein [Mycoplasmopsis verecunda]WPB54611.1 hypothetical protein SAM46_00370 [Mycoplasmopsis verecunda]SJZ54095.1 tRNA-binding protein [Mycoplasmopsis verecunda]